MLEATALKCKNEADFPWSPLPLPALSEEDVLLIEQLRIEHLAKIRYATELAIKLQTKVGKDIGAGTEIIERGFGVSIISTAKRKEPNVRADAGEKDGNKGKGQKKQRSLANTAQIMLDNGIETINKKMSCAVASCNQISHVSHCPKGLCAKKKTVLYHYCMQHFDHDQHKSQKIIKAPSVPVTTVHEVAEIDVPDVVETVAVQVENMICAVPECGGETLNPRCIECTATKPLSRFHFCEMHKLHTNHQWFAITANSAPKQILVTSNENNHTEPVIDIIPQINVNLVTQLESVAIPVAIAPNPEMYWEEEPVENAPNAMPNYPIDIDMVIDFNNQVNVRNNHLNINMNLGKNKKDNNNYTVEKLAEELRNNIINEQNKTKGRDVRTRIIEELKWPVYSKLIIFLPQFFGLETNPKWVTMNFTKERTRLQFLEDFSKKYMEKYL